MPDILRLLFGSLVLRPYVFAFLAVHLLGASAFLGWRRTCAFTLITWVVAFAAEASSIRTGIPFGWYYYLPRTADRELWIAGVPFFDSLSFPFLLVASYGLTWTLLGKPPAGTRLTCEAWPRPAPWPHLGVTAALFVLLDVVIDPVALRGDRWFLGQIYGYPEPGLYFGVPLANFVGWGVVGVAATALYRAWERRQPERPTVRLRGRALLCPGLYFFVLTFNLAMAGALREWGLLIASLGLSVPILAWTAMVLSAPGAFRERSRGEGAHIA
jgi:putative membrane protein